MKGVSGKLMHKSISSFFLCIVFFGKVKIKDKEGSTDEDFLVTCFKSFLSYYIIVRFRREK